MSKLETNTIDTLSGTSNLTIGSTNTSTITMPNGALSGQNYPSWMVYLSDDVTGVTENTYVKVAFDAEIYDTDNMYDNSTNYRVTIPTGKAGKYMVQSQVLSYSGSPSNLVRNRTAIYKNGSLFAYNFFDFRNNYAQQGSPFISCIMDLEVNDYIEIFGYVDTVSGDGIFRGEPPSTGLESWFQGFRIGA